MDIQVLKIADFNNKSIATLCIVFVQGGNILISWYYFALVNVSVKQNWSNSNNCLSSTIFHFSGPLFQRSLKNYNIFKVNREREKINNISLQ